MRTGTTRRFLPILVGLAALLAVPTGAQAQGTIDRISVELARMMGERGLTKRLERDGGLHQGEAQELLVDVPSSAGVMIVGICDDGCSDLDLRVSRDGTMLGEDILDDDNPIVQLENFAGGQVRVRVEMPACAAGSCAFRVLVFAR
jgi:hypothetical protein